MIIYLSGNMPQLDHPKKEAAFRTDLLSKGRPYHRLVTFFYPKHCDTVFGILKDEEKEVWHNAYMNRLIESSGITKEQATEVLNAAMEEFDYKDNPIDIANEELSYW